MITTPCKAAMNGDSMTAEVRDADDVLIADVLPYEDGSDDIRNALEIALALNSHKAMLEALKTLRGWFNFKLQQVFPHLMTGEEWAHLQRHLRFCDDVIDHAETKP